MNFKRIISICIIFSSLQSYSQTEKEVSTHIKSVTVYQKGAVIKSESKTLLKPGFNRVSIIGIPQSINYKSVQVNGIGNFSIIAVKTGLSYVKKESINKQRGEIAIAKRDSILHLLKIQNAYLEASKLEESMLIQNNGIKGSQTGLNILELKQITLYFTQRMSQIKQKQKQINTTINRLNTEANHIQEIIHKNQDKEQYFSKIEIDLQAPEQTNATLNLEYLAHNAGWNSLYDTRVNDLNGKINLSHKAQIYQNTGVDWTNITLTVCTGNPMINNEKPILKKRYVDAYEQPKGYKNYRKTTKVLESNDAVTSTRGSRSEGSSSFKDGDRTVSLHQNLTNIEFAIDVPYTIESNNKPYILDLKKYNFDANFELYAAPELDLSAYLTAQTTGLDDKGFESGDMNIFLGGSFVGTVDFDPLSLNDTLILSLGKDKATSIERIRSNDYSKNKILSNSIEETFEYTIKVKNIRDISMKVKIEEQIPIAKSEDIVVNIITLGDAHYDLESGILTWALSLKAKETITLKYIYTLKRPKDKKVDVVF